MPKSSAVDPIELITIPLPRDTSFYMDKSWARGSCSSRELSLYGTGNLERQHQLRSR